MLKSPQNSERTLHVQNRRQSSFPGDPLGLVQGVKRKLCRQRSVCHQIEDYDPCFSQKLLYKAMRILMPLCRLTHQQTSPPAMAGSLTGKLDRDSAAQPCRYKKIWGMSSRGKLCLDCIAIIGHHKIKCGDIARFGDDNTTSPALYTHGQNGYANTSGDTKSCTATVA